jgi:hypothetical protein
MCYASNHQNNIEMTKGTFPFQSGRGVGGRRPGTKWVGAIERGVQGQIYTMATRSVVRGFIHVTLYKYLFNSV